MTTDLNQHKQVVQQWLSSNFNEEQVEFQLAQIDLDDATKSALLNRYKKLKNEKRLTQGIIFIIIGAVMGFVSCVLTITNPWPDLYNIILFGLTSAAIIVAFIGLYLIFE